MPPRTRSVFPKVTWRRRDLQQLANDYLPKESRGRDGRFSFAAIAASFGEGLAALGREIVRFTKKDLSELADTARAKRKKIAASAKRHGIQLPHGINAGRNPAPARE